LTAANPNVFYELGARHTARPAKTLTIFAKNHQIPFNVNFLRSKPYDLGEDNAFGHEEASVLRKAIAEKLASLREMAMKGPEIDSLLFQLISDWNPGDIAHIKTKVFRDQVQLKERCKQRLAEIRAKARIKGKQPAPAVTQKEHRSILTWFQSRFQRRLPWHQRGYLARCSGR
jgi:hypothetical protein